MTVECVHDGACRTGEGAIWHGDEARLYWVDIPEGHLYRFDPLAGGVERFAAGAPVGGLTVQANGELLLFMARGAVRAWRDGSFTDTLIAALPDEGDNRFNDVLADPAGRVYGGVMSTPRRAGRLYRIDTDLAVSVLIEGVGTSNGMGFTPDRRQLYYTDTRAHTIYRFTVDAATGAIADRRVFVTVDEGPARPDGMTVDAEGCVWSAMWEGGCVIRFDPDGREMRRVALPARKVTCPAFGGPELDTLYVTTAGGPDRPAAGALAGALFRLDPGVRGVPEFRSRLARPHPLFPPPIPTG